MPSALLLAHIEMWVAELEREVQAFESAVGEVEGEMKKAEQHHCADDDERIPAETGDEMRLNGAHPVDPSLAKALANADHIAELVDAARATLDEAMYAARQVIANEQIDTLSQAVSSQEKNRAQRIVHANLIAPRSSTPLASPDGFEPLAHGATILAGRYRIVELLHARPRLNLYLAYRLSNAREQAQGAPPSSLVAIREIVLTGLPPETRKHIEHAAFEEFVAPGLLGSPRLPGVGDRIAVEHERHYLVMQLRPAREERAARQGRPGRPGENLAVAIPLAELLLKNQQWPEWLDMEAAFEWGVQLCRIAARLHRMGIILGDLDPATILVNSGGLSTWAPVLLVSWPPAPQFWSDSAGREEYAQIFPIAENLSENAFAAPETLTGQADERSDVYSLGAILYLFFTRYAPAASALRQPVERSAQQQYGHLPRLHNGLYNTAMKQIRGTPAPDTSPSSPLLLFAHARSSPFEAHSGMALVPPHLFNSLISPRLEALLQRALALSPAERFPTVFALVEALEAIDPAAEFVDHYKEMHPARRESRITKALEWVRGSNNTGR
jgi:hypothetical protein